MAAKKKSKKSRQKNTPKKKNSFGSFLGRVVKWGFVLGLWMSIILAGVLFYLAAELPSITRSMVFERRPTIIIKDDRGNIVDRYGDMKGEIVDVKNIPPHLVNAVLAIEDRRFYEHYGVDLKAIARAFVVNIQEQGYVQGGSTITQQLAKNLFLSRERTIKRKIQELLLSFQIERELTKDEILSAYLNRVYLGAGTYGVDAAARTYFNKSIAEINLREAAMIAGLLKAPSAYSPRSNPVAAAERANVVLQAMVAAGYVTDDAVKQYKDLPPAPRKKPSSGSSVRYYTDYVVSQLDDFIGMVEEDVIVETTFNASIQQELEKSITRSLLAHGDEKNVHQAAGLVMRLDGAVVSLSGGKNYSVSEFNRVTDSLRPPGSSFKPVVYLAALENGWHIDSIIADEPIIEGQYRPKNYGHEYYGEVTLFEALTLSLNTVAVNLMRELSPELVIDTARRLGITADLKPNLSTALGSSGVPMIQLVNAYAIVGRGGQAIDPYAIKKVTSVKENKVLYRYKAPVGDRIVVDEQAVRQLTAMMQSVIQNGTGQNAKIPYKAAGKTGTSQDFRDAWFIGFTDMYAGGVWFGNDDNSATNRLTGGDLPAKVWADVMVAAQRYKTRRYGYFSDITYDKEDDIAFEELLRRLSDDTQTLQSQNKNKSGGFWGWLNNQAHKTYDEEEYTPRGRHQWDFND